MKGRYLMTIMAYGDDGSCLMIDGARAEIAGPLDAMVNPRVEKAMRSLWSPFFVMSRYEAIVHVDGHHYLASGDRAPLPMDRRAPKIDHKFQPLAAEPDFRGLLEEMLHAFVPSVRSESRFTQAQGSVVIRAREALRKTEPKEGQ